MSDGALAFAFGAGVLAAFNPCGFALLPSWAAYLVAGTNGSDDLLARLLRALRAGAIASLAFVVVFGAAGAFVTAGFVALGDYLPWIGLAIGGVLAALGALLLARGHAPGIRISRRPRRGADASAVFGFGVAYALSSLTCVLPVFLLTIGLAAGAPVERKLFGFVGFALGMGIVLTVIAVAAALAGDGVTRVRRIGRFVPRLAGAVVLAAAVVVIQQEIALAAFALGHEAPEIVLRVAAAAGATTVIAVTALAATRWGQGASEPVPVGRP